ncbi:hypothetical protein MJO29_003300, partial [Puccinia striiformis f. sp. tritici]
IGEDRGPQLRHNLDSPGEDFPRKKVGPVFRLPLSGGSLRATRSSDRCQVRSLLWTHIRIDRKGAADSVRNTLDQLNTSQMCYQMYLSIILPGCTHQSFSRGVHINHCPGVYGLVRITSFHPLDVAVPIIYKTATASTSPPSSHPAFVPRINLLLRTSSIVGTMNTFLFLIPFIIQYFATGMQPPREKLASLGEESAIDNRDGISAFSSPPRMVEVSPVDQVSIDMPHRKEVSAYDTMVHEHNSPYKIPTPAERAMSTYPASRDARDHPISSDQAVTRTRAGPGFTRPQPPEVLVVAYDPTLKRVE